jgi:hypothetical protein
VVKAKGNGIGKGQELAEQGIGRGLGAGHGPCCVGRATPGPDAGVAKLSEGQAAGQTRPTPDDTAASTTADDDQSPAHQQSRSDRQGCDAGAYEAAEQQAQRFRQGVWRWDQGAGAFSCTG